MIPCDGRSSPFTHNEQQRDCIQTTYSSYRLVSLDITTYPASAMAETVGIIASGIQIAGLIGTIAQAGLQIRALYHEIQDASDDVAFRLQELQILSEILDDSNFISSNARSLCAMCLSELHLVLAEMQSQIHRSRGIRRKVASAKVMVKRDVMQKLDSRLERSVRYLMLAQSIHIFSNQNLVLRNQDAMSSSQTLVLHNQDDMM